MHEHRHLPCADYSQAAGRADAHCVRPEKYVLQEDHVPGAGEGTQVHRGASWVIRMREKFVP